MSDSSPPQETSDKEVSSLSIILFYKYHAFSLDEKVMERYRAAIESLCQSLQLKGRILLGCSDSEGINGTLAGSQENVRAFTYALLGEDYVQQHCNTDEDEKVDATTMQLLHTFWQASRDFAQTAGVPILKMDSPNDFKWSSTTRQDLFPDLHVKLVKEIISTGGVLSEISLDETAQGYLTPQEWHEEMLNLDTDSTVLIDCRNTKEHAIGHFPHAVDPKTTTFNQFPQWAETHAPQLQNKKVLMFCTGGIRCEKASAYLRRQGISDVRHLKGGIHKYLEEFGEEGCWQGKNFVFDGRGAVSAQETKLGKDGTVVVVDDAVSEKQDVIVGQCLYCSSPYDVFHAHCVCTVCREPTLVCTSCQDTVTEFHCTDHFHLRTCYFTNLQHYTQAQLTRQLEELQQHLEKIAVGKRFKQKRKTLYKQCDKIRAQLTASDGGNDDETGTSSCRNCGEAGCSGACWGFHGLKRKQVLAEKANGNAKPTSSRTGRSSAGQRVSKQLQRQRAIEEIETLQLSKPPSEHLRLGIRVPPPCTRVLQTLVKGKWCGRSVKEVLQSEFAELAKQEVFGNMLNGGLLRLNGEPLTNDSVYTKLKNMDFISRIVHWHEPPVHISEVIGVEKVALPEQDVAGGDACVYVCDKPSSVPVHPAGPYLSNTLTMMVEAQEKLQTRSLIPCHRIDRVTSGLTLCCTDSKTARVIQGKIDDGSSVRKLYVTRVKGRFPNSQEEAASLPEASSFAKCSWKDKLRCLEVDAPVETVDPANGIRTVSAGGKPSRSRFQALAYDSASHSSLVACSPLTGRGHQLRVHLQWLGFPIDGDVSYGGRPLGSDWSDTVVQRMMDTIADEEHTDLALDSLSPDDVAAARSACCCCKDGKEGIASSFTPSQLLRDSKICLHALRYEISFSRRKRKAIEGTSGAHCAVLELEVELPEWASEFGKVDIDWLQDL